MLQRAEHGLRVAPGPGMEARAGSQPDPPAETVLGDLPRFREPRMGRPVGPLDHQQLVDGEVARIDVRAGRIESRELVVERLPQDH